MPHVPHPLLQGTVPAIVTMLRDAFDFAHPRINVVLEGETGVGKSLVAEYLHRLSGRPGLLVRHNLRRDSSLLDDDLYGHVRGAFTGATGDRLGRIERAQGGTLFLDELQSASTEQRQFLLDLADRKPLTRLGGHRDFVPDAKLLFGFNVQPWELRAEHGFPPDLIYRLGFCLVRIPPLRERRPDLLTLARWLLAEALRHLDKPFEPRLTRALEARLLDHPWPGNLRELESAMLAVAARLKEGEPADVGHLPDLAVYEPPTSSRERKLSFREALRLANDNKREAARLLGCSPGTFYAGLRREEAHTGQGSTAARP
jgi:DNA-binding NtrC family response regulator